MVKVTAVLSTGRDAVSADRQISSSLRSSFEDLIDRLIQVLDIADGDADLEPDADCETENEHAVDAIPQRQRIAGRLVLV